MAYRPYDFARLTEPDADALRALWRAYEAAPEASRERLDALADIRLHVTATGIQVGQLAPCCLSLEIETLLAWVQDFVVNGVRDA